ncbi:MAG: hypothetical protein ACRDG2_01605 [Actinomycetota bacterium]
MKVLCVAETPAALAELKRAAVSAEWELTRGATDEADALAQVHEERPHVLVLFGPFGGIARAALDASPAIRIVADRSLLVPSVVVSVLGEVRAAVLGRPASGPVR